MDSFENHPMIPSNTTSKSNSLVLVILNYSALVIGSISSTLLARFYFIHGGSSRWVSTWVQSAGFPLLLIPIYFTKFSKPTKPFCHFTQKQFVIAISIGFMLGFNNFLFSWGTSYLPVSTSSLLLSTQLVLNLILSLILVKQPLTFTNLNSVILITLSSVILALDSNQDKRKDLTQAHYFMGFFAILGAGLLFALYLPLVELAYKNVKSYEMVMEMQVIMEIAATLISIVGMAFGGGFAEMVKESNFIFDLGRKGYWLTVGFSIVCWQLCFMGTAGLVFFTKSLTSGVCATALLPINVLGGVLVYGDTFDSQKLISTLMCVWGFCSYLNGEHIMTINDKKEMGDEDLEG